MSALPTEIRHVVVLMLENRSFDHLLGKLPGVDGPTGHSNVDPKDSSTVPVTLDADYLTPALSDPDHPGQMAGDPHHDFTAVNRQLFGTPAPAPGAPATCGGFVQAGRESGEAQAERVAREVMKCFDTPTRLKTIAALAAQFVVCDRWFAAVPGPTWPNRLFMHAATSFGYLDNKLRLYPGPTLYDRLDEAQADWAIYYHDIPQSLCLRGLAARRDRQARQCMRPIDEFYKDVGQHRAGDPKRQTLPSYVFLEPAYFEPPRTLWGRLADVAKAIGHWLRLPVRPSKGHPNDQHAPHDVRLGEHLIADVYEALRANEDVWQHCLFVVLHDEHGGLFDHVPPPSTLAGPSASVSPPFAFDRLGLRVPALLISPYLNAGVDSTVYEHVSLVRTVREHFCPGSQALNPREAAAPLLRRDQFLNVPRPDAPKRVERTTPIPLIATAGAAEQRPLGDLQQSLVHLAAAAEPAAPGPGSAGPSFSVARGGTGGVIDLSGMELPPIDNEAEGRAFVVAGRKARGLQ